MVLSSEKTHYSRPRRGEEKPAASGKGKGGMVDRDKERQQPREKACVKGKGKV